MVGVMKEFGTWRNIRFNISSRMHPSGPESASKNKRVSKCKPACFSVYGS